MCSANIITFKKKLNTKYKLLEIKLTKESKALIWYYDLSKYLF